MEAYPGNDLGRHNSACVCRICGRQCFSVEQLSEHLKEHENFNHYQTQFLTNFASFAGYIHQPTPPQPQPCSCVFCGKIFESREAQSIHRCVHISEKGFTCLACRLDYPSVETFKSHFQLCGTVPVTSTVSSVSAAIVANAVSSDRASVPANTANTGSINSASSTTSAVVPKPETPASFPNIASPARSANSSTSDDKLECDVCKKVLPDQAQYDAHVKRHKELQCQTCGKFFKDRYGINRHMKTHFKDSCHSCSVCKKYFAKDTELIKHEQIHNWIKNEVRKFLFQSEADLECSVCDMKFSTAEELNSHVSLHIEANDTYKCLLCLERFQGDDNVLALIGHMVANHGRKTPYRCEECGKYFIDNAKFVRHATCHNPPKTLLCEICNMAFTRQHRLNVHMNKHTGERPYQCSLCQLCFQSPRTLAKHKRCHAGKSLSCDICQQILTDKCAMLDHKARVHTGPDLIHCEECGIPYSSKMYLSVHMKNIHGYTDKDRPTEFQCNVCGKYTKTSSSLNAHMKTHGSTKFRCEICDKGFISENNLKQHFRVHLSPSGQMTTENYRKCRYCDKEFESRKQCAKHMVTHTKERPHVCEVCGKSYTLKATLSKHMVSYHMSEEDITAVLKCDICGLRCFTADSLEEHVNQHALNDEHICVECGDSFQRSKDLKEHRKSVHSPSKKRGRPKKGLLDDMPSLANITDFSFQSLLKEHNKASLNIPLQPKCKDVDKNVVGCSGSMSTQNSDKKNAAAILSHDQHGFDRQEANKVAGYTVPFANSNTSNSQGLNHSISNKSSSSPALPSSPSLQKPVPMDTESLQVSHGKETVQLNANTNEPMEETSYSALSDGSIAKRSGHNRVAVNGKTSIEDLPRCSLCGICFLNEDFLRTHFLIHTAGAPVKQEVIDLVGAEQNGKEANQQNKNEASQNQNTQIQPNQSPTVQNLHSQQNQNSHQKQNLHVQQTQSSHVQHTPNSHVQHTQNPHVQHTQNLHVQHTQNSHVQQTQNTHVQHIQNSHVQNIQNSHVQQTQMLHVQQQNSPVQNAVQPSEVYKCSVCAHLFGKSSELERHIQVHAGQCGQFKMMRFHLAESRVCVHFTDVSPSCSRSYDSL